MLLLGVAAVPNDATTTAPVAPAGTTTSNEPPQPQQQQQHITTSSSSSSNRTESVHLRLQTATTTTTSSPASQRPRQRVVETNQKESDDDSLTTTTTNSETLTSPENNNNNSTNATKTVQVISFRERMPRRRMWRALNTSPSKFLAFLSYRGIRATRGDLETSHVILSENHNHLQENIRRRNEWRALWKKERLLTDRTELLAIYPSDSQLQDDEENNAASEEERTTRVAAARRRRGGFSDHLFLYVDRLLGILEDERDYAAKQPKQNNNHHKKVGGSTASSSSSLQYPSLVDWLSSTYGQQETQNLLASNLQSMAEPDQLRQLKAFLEWFRGEFPYFYDRCGACGASVKEDLAARQSCSSNGEEDENEDNDEDVTTTTTTTTTTCDHDDKDEHSDAEGREDQSFLGYIYPTSDELLGKASRTELYRCVKCLQYTRFPRYNSARHVIESRRGRCGEYSVLLFEIMRALGHETRWIVDWTDHVWVEVNLVVVNHHRNNNNNNKRKNRWVHLDPCEAAVDENLLYQGWGKKQTYILAFYAPANNNNTTTTANTSDDTTNGTTGTTSTNVLFPLIEDVTHTYTSDAWKDIAKRREESEAEVRSAIAKATDKLQKELALS